MDILGEQMQGELEKLEGLRKQQQKALASRQLLDSQLNENQMVKEEMEKLEPDAGVFKLVGPALVRQDQAEARQNVDKRIGYISGELRRQEDLVKELETKQEEHRRQLQTLQTQMQKLAAA